MPRQNQRSRATGGWTVRFCVSAVLALAFLSLSSSVARAATGLNLEDGSAITPPANAGPNPEVTVTAISCSSAGDCSAVGSYDDASGNAHGLLATETDGQWTQAVEPTLVANADSQPRIGLTAVSCPAAGYCTAIGHYLDVNGLTQGFYVTETAGTWGTMKELSHPQGVPVTTNPRITLTSISCASVNSCSIVGTYLDNQGKPEGLLETENSGTWTSFPQEAALPADAGREPLLTVTSVSCGTAGECDAVGSYVNQAGDTEGLFLTETDGNWEPGAAAVLPTGANEQPEVTLESVSCVSAGNCTAVGSYVDASGDTQGLMFTETGGTWGSGVTATLPMGASASPSVALTSVSCSSAGNCAAVGNYFDASDNVQGVLLNETGSSWSPGVKASLPSDAGTPTVFVSLLAVSCYADGDCAAVGNYTDNNFVTRPLIVSETGASWSPAVEPTLPYAGSDQDAYQGVISCVAGTQCVSLFAYLDNENDQLTAAVDGGPEAPSTELLALSSAPPTTAEVSEPIAPSDLAATLSGGTEETGSITYTVFGPQASAPTSCAYGGTVVGSATVQGDGTYSPSSGSFTPAAGGDYWWFASYGGDDGQSGGEADNPADTSCGSEMAETVISSPTVSVAVPTTDSLNSTVGPDNIGASLSGVTSGAQGTITFTVYGPLAEAPTSCTGSNGTVVGTPIAVSGAATYNPSTGFTPAATGNYWWYASYSGDPDSGNPAAASNCGVAMAETVVPASTSLSLNPPSSAGVVGNALSTPVSASLTAGTGAETGAISFTVFGPLESPPTSCTSGGTDVGTAAVQGVATYTPSAAFVPGAAGDYWWYASYSSGDSGDLASSTTCGAGMPETTVAAAPGLGLAAPTTVVAGTAIPSTDVSASLVNGQSETGTVTFQVFGPEASAPTACSSGGTAAGTASVSGDGSYQASQSTTLSVPGHYWWYASYSGDSNNAATTSGCGANMVETVVTSPVNTTSSSGPATVPSITTTVTTTQTTTAPTTSPKSKASLHSTLIRVRQTGSSVTVSLGCKGAKGQICSIAVSVTVTETLTGGKVVAVSAVRHLPRLTGVVTLGAAGLRLDAGKMRTLAIKLNKSGSALVKARHVVKADLQVLQGGRVSTTRITLRLQRKSTSKPR